MLLVSALSTGTQLGYFSAAFRVLEGLTVLPGILIGSVLPIFARAAIEDHARLGYALGKVFEVTLMVGVWVGGSVVIGAPLAIHVIAGAGFSGAGSVLAIQGIALGSMFVGFVWSTGLLSLGLYRVILILNASALALDVVLVTALAIPFGARGAAAGTAVTGIVIAISEAIAVSWGRRQLRPPLKIVPRVAAAGVAGMAPALLLSVPTTVRLCIWTIVFGFVLIATRAIPSELWEMIPRLRSRGKSSLSSGHDQQSMSPIRHSLGEVCSLVIAAARSGQKESVYERYTHCGMAVSVRDGRLKTSRTNFRRISVRHR